MRQVKKVLALLLVLVMAASLLPSPAFAANGYEKKTIESNYFYNQLNDRAKAIYDKLLGEFTGGSKEEYYAGTKPIDLMGLEDGSGNVLIGNDEVAAYREGNKDIFNDFCAAKDALDLDHSELWWLDSGYLTFRVTHSSLEEGQGLSEGYHVLIGPGRGPTYLLGGQEMDKDTVAKMDKEVNDAIDKIVDNAVSDLNINGSDYSDADKAAYLVTHIHNQITQGIHYRYETQCHKQENAKYIRTIYGIQTHEGVCEAYARTLQVALRRAGVECVLIHGVQTKGTPEDHMWNAVKIGGKWYVVDATWDDPLVANYDGTQDLTFKSGLDGRETNTYLLVGQSLVGEYWRPSGVVSTGGFEFKYPDIERYAYSGTNVYGSDDENRSGLQVKYTAGSTTEDNVAAGTYTITYNGMNATKASENNVYFMLKMYDYHPDGTADVMQDWYYADAVMFLAFDNPYIKDTDSGFQLSTSTCEYVEIAVTTRKPDHRDEWSNNPYTSYLSLNPEAGFFHGDESEIIDQTGMLYNMNSGYEAPPYVKTQTPAPNGNATAGWDYEFKVTYDDLLYHILPTDEEALSGIATADAYESNYEQAKLQNVQVRYSTNQQDLHNGGIKTTQVAGNLPFDTDRDGVVDMDASNTYVKFQWIYASDPEADGGWGRKCTNEACHANGNESCDVTKGCPIVGVKFNFKASDLWIDDVTEYNFTIEGVVGSRSSKYPNNFSVIATVPGLCPACYRSQGIDWNLWGQPTLLDSPEDLDLYKMAQEGGTDSKTLAELDEQINHGDINGRLMLVVEDKSQGVGSREEYEKLNGELADSQVGKDELGGQTVAARSVFEINFNRICPMVKLKPNKGQSLRVQVGYPAGITYESLGEGEYELKAFHFTRCSNDGEEYHCDEYKKEYEDASLYDKKTVAATHKWGSHIVSVEEITIIPTPYGMVLMCEAFSPFEIVAIEKDGAGSSDAAGTHDVIVVSDGSGTVYVDGVEAVGANGNKKVADGGDLTITVKPDTGYVVDTVSFGGKAIESNGNGSYTVKGITKSDVLNVTFLPETVKTEEAAQYGETVVAKVCEHKNQNTTEQAKAATCTENGHTAEIVCTDCGAVLQAATVIPATGHNLNTTKEAKPATCTENGNTAAITCNDCHTVVSKESTIQALGHVFTNYVDTEERTCQGTVAVAVCDHEGCTKTDTKTQPWAPVEHSFIQDSTKAATCTTDAVTVMKCKWCGETTEVVQEGTATGHKPGADGICENCHTYLCADGHSWTPTPEVPAKCLENGHKAGRKCTVCGLEEQGELIPALNHDFGDSHTAGTKCKRCEVTLQSDQHKEVAMENIPATCTTEGSTGGTHCSQCGTILTHPEIVPALGHDWKQEDATWHWSTEGKVTASVTLTCSVCSAKETFEAEVSKTQGSDPTCVADGSAVYSATVTVIGRNQQSQKYTDTGKTLTVPATGRHTWELTATTEATCTQHATETYECTVCGATKLETLTDQPLAEHTPVIDHEKSVPATCTTAGKEVFQCGVCGQELSEKTIPAQGHDYQNGVCTRCGEKEPSAPVDPGPSGPSGPSGSTTTTTNPDGSRTTTTKYPDGSQTVATTTKDGVTGKTSTDKNGVVTSAAVTVPSSAAAKGVVIAPVKVDAVRDGKAAPKIDVRINGGGSAKVEIPVTAFGPGTVAVLVNANGTEKVVRDCVTGENGVVLNVEGDVTLKIVDNSKTFEDVDPVKYWASDAVEFVTAHELFKGTSGDAFSPEAAMNRGMLVTVLYRLAYEPETTGGGFADVRPDQWFADSIVWAAANGIVDGYGDGSFGPVDNVTREQMVTILYRYAEKKSYVTGPSGSLAGYADAGSVSSYARQAMGWAIETGLIRGVDSTHLDPAGSATRAQVAAILMRFCENVIY